MASTLTVAALMATAVAGWASPSDLERAWRGVPQEAFRGDGHAAIRSKLNAALQRGAAAMLGAAPCEEFALEELSALELALFEHRADELVTSDLRAPRHATLASLRAEIAREAAYAQEHPEVVEALRDSKCAEIAMQWVHHLAESARQSLARTRLPLLANRGTAEHSPELLQRGHHEVARSLSERITCQIGHDAVDEPRGDWEGYPSWPFEVTYNATGYGAYPFWVGGVGNDSLAVGAPIRSWWSAVLNAERLDHNGKCSLGGLEGWSEDAPCTHLMLGSKYAYLFDQAQTHCCITSKPDYVCHMTRMQRNFYKVFNYTGVLENYTSESGYYTGPVKKYSMHVDTALAPFFGFWYVTDLEDRPIEQGEGPCDMYSAAGDRNCQGPPHYIFHQYDPKTFESVTLDPEVFAVPEVCQKTQSTCLVFPTDICGDVI